ncbi:MAG TPA: ABC transporter ATP-binding protein [Anaeromyxobacter sp.]
MHTYFRLFRFAAPYKLRIALAILCMGLLSLSTAAYANLLGPMLEFLFTGSVKSLGILRSFAPSGFDMDAWLATVDRKRALGMLPWVVIGVSGVKGIASFGQQYLMGMVGQRMIADLRRATFDRLVRLSPAYYAQRASGDIQSRVSGDVWAVDSAITGAIPSYVRDGLTVVVMLVNCFVLDWRMSIIVFGVIPVTLLPVIRLTKKLKRVTTQAAETAGTLSTRVQEVLHGMRVVQAYGMEAHESARFGEVARAYVRAMRRGYLVRSFTSPLMEVMAAAGISAAIWWVGGQILAGQIEPAKFFSFIAAVMLLYQPVKQLGRMGQTAIAGASAAERIFEILDAESPVRDDGKLALAPLRRSIAFERVTFSYDGVRTVLDGFDLEIRKGEMIALVGQTGGGKTTVANLLPRFFDPTGGRILVDGVDIREATLASLRAQIAIVTQETVIFHSTVRANIAYGRPDASTADVERAARLAEAHEFIARMPEGYDSPVGERGGQISGGQRQRLAIARAFLKDAPILILDEATSALDAETEREVQRSLDKLVAFEREARRTVLVIAHRLSTIRKADRIVVISGGRVAEIGPHDELVARGGEYARLHRIYEGEEAGEEARATAARA